jgi:hypothetical protein
VTEEPSDRPTAAPFLIALTIIVLIVIGIGAVNFFESDELTDEQLIGRAAVAQNDALQRLDYADFRTYTCREEQGSEARFTDAQQDSAARNGARIIDGVAGVNVVGDRATATVTYHFDRDEDAKTPVQTTFVREDGAWKVCAATPS